MASDTLARMDDAQLERLPPVGVQMWTPEKVDLLKRTVCRDATDDELDLFLTVCKHTGLDPFLKQVYAIKRKNRRTGREDMSIQVGIDGFRLLADRSGRYAPGRTTEFAYDDRGKLASATAFVKKLVAGEWHEFGATAWWEEYCQTYDGKPQGLWNTMPRVMLAKVAEAIALRKGFPAELSGLHTPEEMDQADAPPVLANPRTAYPAPRAIAEHNGVTADAKTGEVLPPKPAAARPAVNAEKTALIGEVKSLITLAAADESIKLGKAETPGIKALVASCRAQGCHPTAMLLDGLSMTTLTLARDELAAALAEAEEVVEAAAEMDEQMDAAIAGDKDPFKDDE